MRDRHSVVVSVGVSSVGGGSTVDVGVGSSMYGVGDGVAVTSGVGDGVAVTSGVGDGVAVTSGVGDGVAVTSGVGVGVVST